MPLWLRITRIWLPVALAATVALGLSYVAAQQGYRNGLDDPQTWLAADGAARLDAGAAPASLVTSQTVDAATSLAPFVAVFGGDGALLASGATIDGMPPKPPAGVLAAARSKGTNRVTWQPRAGVRIATVSAAARDGRVVLAGRNMRVVEARIDQLGQLTALAWAAAMAGTLIVSVFLERMGMRLESRA